MAAAWAFSIWLWRPDIERLPRRFWRPPTRRNRNAVHAAHSDANRATGPRGHNSRKARRQPRATCHVRTAHVLHTAYTPKGLMERDEPSSGPRSGSMFHRGLGMCRKKNVTANMGSSSHSSRNIDEHIASVSSSCAAMHGWRYSVSENNTVVQAAGNLSCAKPLFQRRQRMWRRPLRFETARSKRTDGP
jgi:hypothetical protein